MKTSTSFIESGYLAAALFWLCMPVFALGTGNPTPEIKIASGTCKTLLKPDSTQIDIILESAQGENLGERTYSISDGGTNLNLINAHVNPEMRGQGVSRQLLAQILENNPRVKVVEATLVFDNARAFRSAIATGSSKMDALKATPFFKTLAPFGYSHISRLDEKKYEIEVTLTKDDIDDINSLDGRAILAKTSYASTFDGPNCANAALWANSLFPYRVLISEDLSAEFLKAKCTKVEDGDVRKGDIGLQILNGNINFHLYVAMDKGMIFQKRGFMTKDPYEIIAREAVGKVVTVPEIICKNNGCQISTEHYRCGGIKSLDSELDEPLKDIFKMLSKMVYDPLPEDHQMNVISFISMTLHNYFLNRTLNQLPQFSYNALRSIAAQLELIKSSYKVNKEVDGVVRLINNFAPEKVINL